MGRKFATGCGIFEPAFEDPSALAMLVRDHGAALRVLVEAWQKDPRPLISFIRGFGSRKNQSVGRFLRALLRTIQEAGPKATVANPVGKETRERLPTMTDQEIGDSIKQAIRKYRSDDVLGDIARRLCDEGLRALSSPSSH